MILVVLYERRTGGRLDDGSSARLSIGKKERRKQESKIEYKKGIHHKIAFDRQDQTSLT